MSTDITLPALGESVTEGTVTRWLKAVGDTVAVDEPLVEISTDKVDTEIPSPVAGVLLEILIPEDETAVVGAVLARIGAAGDAPAAPASAPEVVATPVEAAPVEATPVAAAPVAPAPVAPAPVAAAPVAAAPVALPPVSPVVEAPVVPVETAPVAAPAAVVAAAPAAVEPTAAPAPSGGRDIVLPALGESVTEGTVTRWLKAVGDAVTVDEPLLEISTDKVDTEIPSPFAGVLTEILVREDDTATVGAVLGRISAAGVAPTSAPPLTPAPLSFEPAVLPAPVAPAHVAPAPVAPAPVAPAPVAPAPVAPAPVVEAPAPVVDAPVPVAAAPAPVADAPIPVAEAPTPPVEAPAPVAPPAAPATPPAVAASDAGRYVTPIVRKLAADSGVDISSIAGSGVGGRIRKEDVLAAAAPVAPPAPVTAPVAATAAPATPSPSAAPTAPAPASAPGTVSPLRGTTVKMTRLRSIIAQRMVESMRQQAQLTTVVEVDVTRVATLRSKAKDSFQARENAKLTFLPFFTKAAAEALREHPALNASIDGENIVYHPTENIAIAVDTEKGLVAPIIKGAGEASLADHARAIGDLAARARTNQLTLEDLTGATFTVTNTGSGGALFDTPIVVSPQVAIMGTGAIARRAVVVTDDRGEEVIAIRSMCYLSISYDHRLVDGADAARFLATVKARIEDANFETELGL